MVPIVNPDGHMRVVAVIPALNELERLQRVVEAALRLVDFVIIVDDGSKTPLQEHLHLNGRVKVLRHMINLGKGAAMKTGVIWAIRQKFEAVVFIDADGQHDPSEIPGLLGPLRRGQADLVFGIRKFHGRMPLVARFGNLALTKALQFLYRIHVDDSQSGYRAMRLAAFEKINWRSPRYAVETEMIVNAGKHKVPYTQVPISTIYHDKYKGTTIIDGIRIMINMITWKLL